MRSEAKGIVRALYDDLSQAPVAGTTDIMEVLDKVMQRLNDPDQSEVKIINRLAGYIAFTVFTNKIRFTKTQNLLVSQLMSAADNGLYQGNYGDKSWF